MVNTFSAAADLSSSAICSNLVMVFLLAVSVLSWYMSINFYCCRSINSIKQGISPGE